MQTWSQRFSSTTTNFRKNDLLQDAGYPLNNDREAMVAHTYFLLEWRKPATS
jgi:hypothetical protein